MPKPQRNTQPGSKALEITMRDVLGGLEEMACYACHHPHADDMEILSIETPNVDPCALPRIPARVHQLTTPRPRPTRSTDVVDYLLQRERALAGA